MDCGICVLVRMYEASGLFIPSKNSDCAYLKNNNNNDNDISKAGIMNFLKSSLDWIN